MRGTAFLLGLAMLTSASVARGQEAPALPPLPPVERPSPPPTGLSWLVVGSLATAGGVINLAGAPLCELHIIRSTARTPCLVTSLGFGIGLAAVGIPLIVVGAGKRAAWLDWTRRMTVVAGPGSALVGWSTSW